MALKAMSSLRDSHFHQVKLSSNFLTFHYVSFASWCFREVCLGSDFSINLK